MTDKLNFLLINIVDEDGLIEMMMKVEKYINSEILQMSYLGYSHYSVSTSDMQSLAEYNDRIKQLKTRTMDFLKQGRIIGITGHTNDMTHNKHFYGITIHGGRVDLMGVYKLKDDNYYNHCQFPNTKQIFEEIIKIKDGTDFKEFLEDREFFKLYGIDFSQLYHNVSSIIFNNFYHHNDKNSQEKIFKFVKHHKIIYAQRISNKNIFCINIYGFIIISDDNTLYDVDKILIYSKEETLTTEYFHKYIKESDIYNKYIDVGVKLGDNIFVLEQKLKEKKEKEQKEKEEEKNSYKKIIDDLIKEVTCKLDNYNEEMLQYFIKKVSFKDKYIELYKYYIEEVLNYKEPIEKLKKDILFQFIDDIYNEKYTNGNRDLRFDIRYNVNLPNEQQRIDIIFCDLLEKTKLNSYCNGIKSDESFLKCMDIKEKIEKIFVNLLCDIRSYLYNRGGNKTLALVYILENVSNIKKTILNFDINEEEFKIESRKIVSKICDYDKLLKVGIKNPYFVFNKNK
jgi:hypothetical protein